MDHPAVAPSERRPDRARPSVPATRPPVPSERSYRPAVTLYHHDGVLVTHDVLQVGERRYRVAALRGLRTARGTRGPVTLVTVVLAAAVLAAVGVTVSFGRQPSGPGRETYLVLLAAVLVPAAIAVYGRCRARRRHELWGEYHGETVLLYASPDEREFGQVTRALLRAHESRRP